MTGVSIADRFLASLERIKAESIEAGGFTLFVPAKVYERWEAAGLDMTNIIGGGGKIPSASEERDGYPIHYRYDRKDMQWVRDD